MSCSSYITTHCLGPHKTHWNWRPACPWPDTAMVSTVCRPPDFSCTMENRRRLETWMLGGLWVRSVASPIRSPERNTHRQSNKLRVKHIKKEAYPYGSAPTQVVTRIISAPLISKERQWRAMYTERQQEALTIVSTFLGLNRFLFSGRPHAQPLFTYAVQWCGLQVQLAVWVGLGGHGHAIQEAGEHGVASRRFLHGGFDRGVVAYALWGRRVMVDFRTGFGIPRGFLWISTKK